MWDYTVNSRTYCVTTDSYGIDPHKDKAVERIAAIDAYTIYEVKQSQRGRPDNIANAVYNNSNLWWVVMYYNGITNFKNIKEGLTLRIPIQTEVTRILAETAAKVNSSNVRTISI